MVFIFNFYAYSDAASGANINKLLLIPYVVLDFLYVHPFRDRNGRMSRLITLLLLYRNGFSGDKRKNNHKKQSELFNKTKKQIEQNLTEQSVLKCSNQIR